MTEAPGDAEYRGSPAKDAAPPEAVTPDLRVAEALFALSGEVGALLRPDGKLFWATPNVERVLGLTAEDVIDQSGLGMVHELDRERVGAELAGLEEPGSSIETSFRVEVAGELRWVEVKVVNRVSDPQLGCLVGTFCDVTEQRRSEVAVRLEATLLANSGQAITALDPDGVVNYWNAGAEAVYGWSTDEAIGRSTGDLVPVAEGSRAIGVAALKANEEARQWSYELEVVRKDGQTVAIHATGTPLLDEQGNVVAITVVSYDISKELRHREIEGRLASIVETSHDAIFSTDLAGHITTWNEGASLLYGHSEQEALGRNAAFLTSEVHTPDLLAPFEMATRGERSDPVTTVGRHADGTSIHVAVSTSPIRRGEEVIGVSIIANDVTERVVAQKALAHQATHDPLSGLANRRLFVERLEQALERCEDDGTHTGVVFIDLDDFKLVNDRHGHVDGDHLLRKVGQRIAAAVADHDVVARLGGDEYLVASAGLTDHDDLWRVVDRIQRSLAIPFWVGGESRVVRASIGIALSGSDTPAEALIRNADVAMYAAKQGGGNSVELFDDELYAEQRRRKAMAFELQTAIREGQFETYFQPELKLSDESLFGFEALVRWNHPGRGVVPPNEFIELAEQTGSIVALGRRVLRDACGALCSWRRDHPDRPVIVSVNLSPVQLVDPQLADVVREAIADNDLPPSMICLEVTESALMEFDEATKALARLKDVGVTIAIDDFGTGYSSLSRLKAFPVDFLKIDRSFIQALGRDQLDDAIVGAITTLSGSMGVEVIAEGIETVTQLDRLREIGCAYGQGYLWSRPVPEQDAAEIIARPGPVRRAAS